MKGILQFIVSVFLCMICMEELCAQNFSNKGKEFWVGYGHHQFMEPNHPETERNTQNMVIYLSAEEPAIVTVTIDSSAYGPNPNWTRTYSIPANTVISTGTANPSAGAPAPLTPGPMPKGAVYDARLFSLPCSFLPVGTPCGAEQIFRGKGIHIVSNVPIVAYAHIYGSVSSGATMLMPVESWGYSYTSVNSDQTNAADSYSWMYVIAQHDSTVIRIIPSVTSRLGKPPGVPFDITLNKGQIYQLIGQTSGSDGLHLTGSTVKSIANSAGNCYPVAVFSGSSRTGNRCGGSNGLNRDNDMQQLFPQQAWGKRYLTAPTSRSGTPSQYVTNMYKIAVKDPTSIVRRNGVQLTGLTNNYYYFESNTADYIESDQPIMVAQFLPSSGTCSGGSLGDPEMMYISPIEQAIKRTGFYRTTLEAIQFNYVTAIIPTAGLTSLTIEGTLFSAIPAASKHSYAHPNLPGYTVAIRRWTAAQSQVIMQSDSGFTAVTYGLGGFESYGYNAGTLLNNLNAVGAIFNSSDTSSTTVSHPFTCTATPVKLSVLLAYPTPPTRLVWQLSLVGGGLTPNINITDNSPTPAGTQSANGLTYFKYELPGNYTFTTAGTYTVPILVTHPSIDNCNNTERVSYDIEVRGKPASNFAVTSTGCYLDTVFITGQTVSANGFNINQWLYTFPDATTSVSKDTSKRFAAPGNYNVRLRIVSAEGCVGDTTKTISLTAAPVVGFASSAPTTCLGSVFTFTDTSSYTGTGTLNNSWWDFGDGTIVTATNVAPITHTYTSYGTFTVLHTAGAGASCIGNPVSQTITVFAPPTTSFTYPAGCLPASGTVNFTSTASTPDGQAITGHLWNFGDPASGVNNTSTLANPTHTYPGFGNYTITYRATTANGCTKDTTVNATLNLAPTFNYPALAPVCQNSTTPISVATATVTNGVPGAGVYRGPGTNAAGNFNPATAGAGAHTIWYVYTTTANCIDSVSQTITVNPTPDASFAITTAACLPASGIVPFNYNGTALPGQTYLWNFGDPASGANNTSTLSNPTHNYTTGTYTISLTVTSADGCVKDSVVTNTFNVTPALNYPVLAPVCESVTGTISVATATVTNGVLGTGEYSGPGTDAAGNFNPSVAGPGTHTITYTFTSTGNCVATTTQTIVVNAKPNASFTYPTAACLPTTGIAQFTYNGTVTPGQTYLWNFGDPASGANNTSALANPTHTYTNTGTYSVSVTVTNANGCVDDSVITTTFSVTPALNYPALTAVCESVTGTISVATATVTNGVLGTGVYSGPGTDASGNFNPSVAGPGTHTITYTFTSTGNCVATTTQTIVVNAKPNASFTYPTAACLPTTGIAPFTYNGTVTAGQTYSWNFGDPASGANNTSALANPIHVYTNTGSYSVSVTVTNANGCVDDSVITTTFSVTPALNYPVLTAVCESVTGTISVATATVTNGVLGTGVYSGPGTNAAGNFNPSVAGPGTHIITYTFTSTGNCVATTTQTIVVNPKPIAAFSMNASICLGEPATIVNSSSIPSGSISSWNWNYGDGNTATYTNGNTYNYSYTTSGTYIVKLVTVSANGCVSDTVRRTIVVNSIPVASFSMPASVCMPNGTVAFTNNSTVAGGLGLTYVWNFGDGNSSTQTSPSHVYAAINPYTVTLRATSSAGCFDDSVRVFNAFFDKPIANFTVAPDSLCQGANNDFTDLSTAPNSSIRSRLWIFGDGSTSTVANPTKRYINPGSYTVKLVVTNNESCVSDTFSRVVRVYLQPVIDAGPSFIVPQGTVIRFNPTANDSTVTNFLWSPGFGLSNAAVLRPTLTATTDQTYTLTATGAGNCTATDFLTVKIFRPVVVPNAFSPNGDNVNDRWQIDNLTDYTGVVVEVFNRYGQLVYTSNGYGTAWDGHSKGKPLPVGTYYYIIQLKNGFKPLNGSVTIIR